MVTPDECAETMGTMEDGMICAGGVEGEDSCQVDIGYCLNCNVMKQI